ncbi:MAG: hypothetical protein ACTH3S_15200 [Marinobacter sp.]|uniref:hypothetical protein n=1 Tax=Marinobacter sp. TaxID=50741 RepID=UPI003F9BD628
MTKYTDAERKEYYAWYFKALRTALLNGTVYFGVGLAVSWFLSDETIWMIGCAVAGIFGAARGYDRVMGEYYVSRARKTRTNIVRNNTHLMGAISDFDEKFDSTGMEMDSTTCLSIVDDGMGFNLAGSEINPATGLPMMGGGIGGVDIAGNPYGFDNSMIDSDIGGSSIEDPFS